MILKDFKANVQNNSYIFMSIPVHITNIYCNFARYFQK